MHFSGVGVGLRVMVMGHRHGAGVLSVCGGSILFVVSPSPILVIPHHPSSFSLLFPHCYPLLSLHCSLLLSPYSPIILPPHCPSSSANTTCEPPHEVGGLFVVDHLACLSCSPLVSSELLLVAELGLGRLVSATIVTSSLESKSKEKELVS